MILLFIQLLKKKIGIIICREVVRKGMMIQCHLRVFDCGVIHYLSDSMREKNGYTIIQKRVRSNYGGSSVDSM